MKKQIFLFAVAALALASCSSENDVVQTPDVQQTAADEIAVNFDAYLNRSTTRAGKNGVIDNTELRKSESDGGGFGVFGYYTNGESYTGSSRPDFFYNQGVFYSDGNARWEYTPIKYWPNEFGNDAISDQVDKVTLFAYAPYVKVEPLTGLVKDYTAPENAINITGMTRNNATGDPLVKYISSLISNHSVDLCYGVAKNDFTSSNSIYNKNEITAGKPYVDVVKPGTDVNSKIFFDFKHALAQLIVTIDANVVDYTSGNPSNAVEKNFTRIWVRSITFEGITQSGALNLNSEAGSPNWYDINGTSLITTGSLTIHDGRKDGREANEAASSENPATLNPTIVQSAAYPESPANFTSGSMTAGVTETKVNLFAEWDDANKKYKAPASVSAPIFVIPTKEKMRVTIVYDVETADDNLAGYLSDGSRRGSTIENRIYKTIDTFGYIEAGKRYTLNLHLGMRTVDFDASVSAWDDYGTDIDLPSNIQTYNGAGTHEVNLAAGDANYTYEFAMSGLTANEIISSTTNTGEFIIDGSLTENAANGAGIAKQSIGIKYNNTTKTKTASARWYTPNTGTWILNFTQQPHILGMNFAYWVENKNLYLRCATGLSGADVWGDTDLPKDDNHVRVWKNGVKLTYGTDYTLAYDAELRGKIVFVNPAQTDDVFRVWIQSGDAAAEEITITR